jgi:cysteine desulfurase
MERIYLDHGASTPVREEVIAAMIPYWTNHYGNPASVHEHGRQARRALEQARSEIAGLLGARPSEIVFTGCGSESDNLALRGVMMAARARGKGNHLITSAVEHKAVLDTAIQLREHHGFDITVLPVDSEGRINLLQLEEALRPDTVLLSIMAANNEIGTYQPVAEVGQIARQQGVLFHTDAIQAAVTDPWDMSAMPVDLMSLAPHKFYGPKGIGILYVREGVELLSSLTGGSQEEGRRAGTVNVPYAVGAATAFRLALAERTETVTHYIALRDRLIQGVLDAFHGTCVLTGPSEERLPHNASFAFLDLSGNELLIHLDVRGISASSGSACLTGDPEPSAVLEAIGLGPRWTKGGLRLTVGRQNNMQQIEYTLDVLREIVPGLRSSQTGLKRKPK